MCKAENKNRKNLLLFIALEMLESILDSKRVQIFFLCLGVLQSNTAEKDRILSKESLDKTYWRFS